MKYLLAIYLILNLAGCADRVPLENGPDTPGNTRDENGYPPFGPK